LGYLTRREWRYGRIVFFFWVLEERWDKGWMLFKENAGAEVLK